MPRYVKPVQDLGTRSRTYFKESHRTAAPATLVTYTGWTRRKGAICVFYTIYGDRKMHRTPRALCAWLDAEDEDFVTLELAQWRERVNALADPLCDAYQPEFYLRDKRQIVKFMGKSASPHTVQQYIEALENKVFPFFARKLRNDDLTTWHLSYHQWYQWLERGSASASTRNHYRVALRRLLHFYREIKGFSSLVLPIDEKEPRPTREGQVLPGDTLPSYDQALAWLRSLPAGRPRWVVTLLVCFGMRVSEALPMTRSALLGAEERSDLVSVEGLLKQLIEKHDPAAMARILVAEKRDHVRDDIVKRFLGDQDTDPKGGPYTAACFHDGLVSWLEDLVATGEDDDEQPTYAQIRDLIRSSKDPLFSQYDTHDFRRLSITHQMLEIGNRFYISRLHGQISESTIERYYQWGLEQKTNATPKTFKSMRKR